MPVRRKALRAGNRGRKPGEPPRLSRLTRTAALTGALIAISIFIRAAAAARFDGFLACTATPYASLVLLTLAQGALPGVRLELRGHLPPGQGFAAVRAGHLRLGRVPAAAVDQPHRRNVVLVLVAPGPEG